MYNDQNDSNVKQDLNDELLESLISIIPEIENTIRDANFDVDKYSFIKLYLSTICKIILQNEKVQFSSLFSQITYIGQKYKLPAKLISDLQYIRIISKNSSILDIEESDIISSIYTLSSFISFIIQDKNSNKKFLYKSPFKKYATFKKKLQLDLSKVRVCVLEKNILERKLLCRAINVGIDLITVIIRDDEEFDKYFYSTFEEIWVGAQLNLIDCLEIDENIIEPSFIVLEPDFLIDASNIAECFQSFVISPYLYFLRRLKEKVSTKYILQGNLSNFFLDELTHNQNNIVTFKETFIKAFKQLPVEFTLCKDIEDASSFKEFMMNAEKQFNNIKRTIENDFKSIEVDKNNVILEPSFYSEKYGFKGRLDLLSFSENNKIKKIIELKSGRTPYPTSDTSKISENHLMQTCVYVLLLQSIYNLKQKEIQPFVFYSSSEIEGTNLRYAYIPKNTFKEIIQLRNSIISIENKMAILSINNLDEFISKIFNIASYQNPNNNTLPVFFKDEIFNYLKIYNSSSDLEKLYFLNFARFVARELYYINGSVDTEKSNSSISNLWNISFKEREQELELISGLSIDDIEYSENGMNIEFVKKITDKEPNLRNGDICNVYIKEKEDDNLLNTEIFKGTIVKVSQKHINVYFRNKQKNDFVTKKTKNWVIEHDFLDNSYYAMYQSLFSFLKLDKSKKQLLLGERHPIQKEESSQWCNLIVNPQEENINRERKRILKKALDAEEYFLLVGPPGTGKTSVYVKGLIDELMNNTNQNILIIAYTNRAVDELCDAICSSANKTSENCENYIRIGSSYSCDEKYRHRLLQNIAIKCNKRKELKDIITNSRILVGTLSSILGKIEILDLKKFETTVIDEASQILEPQIIGLLSKLNKFILIGDHNQLSTITLQEKKWSKIDDESLIQYCFNDCRESLFERLFKLCQSKQWTYAFDTLKYHGRMHYDIANLINEKFYGGVLSTITERQNSQFNKKINLSNYSEFQKQIFNERIVFFDVPKNETKTGKSNIFEAELVVKVAKEIYDSYKNKEDEFQPAKSIGIIAPYRNQIAAIRNIIYGLDKPELNDIMIETVERYQGSQRDVIIVSFCFNSSFHLERFINLNHDGTVDRKINVAISRAREQLILVGNWEIIKKNELYKSLLEDITRYRFDN